LKSFGRKKSTDGRKNDEMKEDIEDTELEAGEDTDNADDPDAVEVRVVDTISPEETERAEGDSRAGTEDPAVVEQRVRADEYLDHLQRLKAEFENYRKRVVKEREDTWRRARGDVILSFIPFIDDMRRLLAMSEKENTGAALVEGVRLIEKGMIDYMKKEGLEEIDADGKPFDPSFHEAVGVEVVDNRDEDGRVGEVLLPGFMYKDSLLRPAKVRVLKYVEKDESDADETSEDQYGE
jgi:molecular chaperone GrpE